MRRRHKAKAAIDVVLGGGALYPAGVAPRGALYLLPSMAVLATAALVLGPGRERPAIGVRVWGLPTEGGKAAALRLETMERQFGSDQAVSVEPLEVTVTQGGRTLGTWKGRSGEDGVAEAVIEVAEPLAGQIEVRAASGGRALAQGAVALRPAKAIQFERRMAEGKADGEIALRVEIARGVLASPFAGVVRVTGAKDGQPAGGLVTVTVTGADLDPESQRGLRLDANGEASIVLTPTWHAVELTVGASSAREDGAPSGGWQGGLPVQPGALWMKLRGDVAEVQSPVPRDRIYVSALGEKGRVFGAIVGLARDEKGVFGGTLPMGEVTRLGAVALTLAGDAQELGSGTVTFPLASTLAVAAPPRVELLVDGVPFAEKIEKKRAGLARLVSVGVAFVAALFEGILLVLYSRASQAKLAAHLAEAAEDADDRAAAKRMTAAPASRALTLVLLVGLVVLGFGAVAAFAVVR